MSCNIETIFEAISNGEVADAHIAVAPFDPFLEVFPREFRLVGFIVDFPSLDWFGVIDSFLFA